MILDYKHTYLHALMIGVLVVMLTACGGGGSSLGRSTSKWDSIDYQRTARSPRNVYDNDAYYSLPSVVSCGMDDDVPCSQ